MGGWGNHIYEERRHAAFKICVNLHQLNFPKKQFGVIFLQNVLPFLQYAEFSSYMTFSISPFSFATLFV